MPLGLHMYRLLGHQGQGSCSFSGNRSGSLSFSASDLSLWGQKLYDHPLPVSNRHLRMVGENSFFLNIYFFDCTGS